MAFDFQGARGAGYTDAEIVAGLAPKEATAKFDVDGALKAGYTAEEIVAKLGGESAPAPKKSTNAWDAVKQGAANPLLGAGETAEQYLGEGVISKTLKGMGEAVRPANYEQARLYSDKEGFTPSQIPRVVVEGAPTLAATVAAYKLGSRIHPIAGALAAGATSLGMSMGGEAKRSADARTGVEGTKPEFQDKARAALYSAPIAVLDATGAGTLASQAAKAVGTKGVTAAALNYIKKVGVETGTEGAQEAIAQGGSTIGTDKGMRFKGEDIINSGLSGGVVAGAHAAPSAIKQTTNAVRLAKFGGDNQAHATYVGNLLDEAAGGDLGNSEKGAKAFNDVERDLRGALATAVKAERDAGTLGPDPKIDAAIARSAAGEALNKSDHAALDTAPASVREAAKRITVLAELGKQNLGSKDNFKAGLSTRLEKSVRALNNPVGYGVGGALGAMHLTGQAATMGSSALGALGAVGGAYALARAIDRGGARNPVKRFRDQFADGKAPNRNAPAVVTPEAPVEEVPFGPWNMSPRPNIGGIGGRPVAPEAFNPRASNIIDDGMRKRAEDIVKDRSSQASRAEAALRKLAARNNAPTPESPSEDPAALATAAAAKAAKDAKWRMDLRRNSDEAARKAAEAAYKQQGTAEARGIAAGSPLLEEVGGRAAVENPTMGRELRKYIGTAQAIKKITAQPTVDEEAATTQPEVIEQVVKVVKAKGKLKEKTKTVKAPKAVPVQVTPEEPTPAPSAPLELAKPNGPAPAYAPREGGIAQRALAQVRKPEVVTAPVAEPAPVPTPAPAVSEALPKVKAIKGAKKLKEKAKPEVEEDPYVPSVTAGMNINEAVDRIYGRIADAGEVMIGDPSDPRVASRVKKGIKSNITAIRAAAAKVAAETGVDARVIADIMEGVDRKKHKAREALAWLGKKHKKAAKSLLRNFNDEMIATTWKQ